MHYQTKKTEPLNLNSNQIAETDSETHLGLQRTSDGKNIVTVQERAKTGRRTAYHLMGVGLHGLNGISPATGKAMLETYVVPAMIHGLEALNLSDTEYDVIESAYRKLLRQIQHLPDATAKEAIYLLAGAVPMVAIIHKRILTFFCSMLRRKDSTEKAIITRQLAIKDMDSKSWVTQVHLLLHKYNLPSAFNLLSRTPKKHKWKCTVRRAVEGYWWRTLKDEASLKPSLKYLDLSCCKIGQPHPICDCGTNPTHTKMATVQAMLVTQRYPLSSYSCAGRKKRSTCPLCHKAPETIEHFLVTCQALFRARMTYMKKISKAYPHITDPRRLTYLILQPPRLLSGTMRKLCFALHEERSYIMGDEEWRM